MKYFKILFTLIIISGVIALMAQTKENKSNKLTLEEEHIILKKEQNVHLQANMICILKRVLIFANSVMLLCINPTINLIRIVVDQVLMMNFPMQLNASLMLMTEEQRSFAQTVEVIWDMYSLVKI